jgi:hypothetical protein
MESKSTGVYNLIKSKNPRLARILKDCNVYKIIDMPYGELYQTFGKNMSIETISCIMAEIFVNDERVTNTMSCRPELMKAHALLKTDFGFIIADSLGIGRNKAQYFIDQALIAGYFTKSVNTLDNNAKFIKPAIMTDDELHQMYVRICGITGIEVTKQGFNNFMGRNEE